MINNNDELYDKCENMEQLFENYYLPLRDNWNKLKEKLKEMQYVPNITGEDYDEDYSITEILEKMQELEKGEE